MKNSPVAITLAVVAALVAGGFGFWASQQVPSSRQPQLPAESIPDLGFNDLEGKLHKLSEWHGKLLLVNFWASWCAPCVEEMPLLVAAQKQYAARGLQIIGPAMDDAAAVKQMAAKLGVTYPIMADFEQVDAAMAALGDKQGALPFSVLIGPDGKVVEKILGGLHQDELKELLEAHLGP